MIVKKTLSFTSIIEFAGHHLVWLCVWMSSVVALYYFTHWTFIIIPALPVALIGTAVALNVGFKNNQSYDRLWESRKIWDAIAANSRKLATMICNFNSGEGSLSEGTDAARKQKTAFTP